jgi:phosphoglucosamine mutase
MGKLFGTDGIRGVANVYPMDVETAVSAGRAIAQYFRSDRNEDGVICIGQDTRLSGDMITQAVSAGICSAGMNASLLGVVPTPAVAYLTHATGARAGVVISASHNPFEDNGIKLFNSNGYKLEDKEEDEIEALMEKGAGNHLAPMQIGHTMTTGDAGEQYLGFLKAGATELNIQDLKIVVDCSNGAASHIAPEIFRRLGATVWPIYCSPNGTNINDGCGSQHPEKLAHQVVENNADLGLAFDGDGDRLIAVDEKGGVLTGDQIMAICAKDLKNKGILKHNKVVSTVMSNMGFRIAMKALGVELFITQVGDRYVMQEMMAQDAVLGGEDSGHMIFLDRHTTGDGIMAALRLMDAIQSVDAPLSDLSNVMTVFPQVLINVDVQSKPDLSSIPEIREAIKVVESELGDQGRVLVRYSGTQLKCRVMVEGPTKKLTEQLCIKLVGVVKTELG